MDFSDRFIYLIGLFTVIIFCIFGIISAARFLLICFYRNYRDVATEAEVSDPENVKQWHPMNER
jgi:hypothetical protein